MTSLVIEDGGADTSTVAWGRVSRAVNHCVLHRLGVSLPLATPGPGCLLLAHEDGVAWLWMRARESQLLAVPSALTQGDLPWEQQLHLVAEGAGVPTVCATYCVHHQLGP